jgi:hypothetical protein
LARKRRRKSKPSTPFASTEARHVAERFGLYPAEIPATGRGGKITVTDVVLAAKREATDRTPPAGAHAGARVHKWPASKLPPWGPKFLDALSFDPNVSRAAAGAGIGRQHAYATREKNADFAACWNEAIETAVDEFESETCRRAFGGISRPVYQGGKRVGFVREYSDQLAALMLKAHRPQKYREVVEMTATFKPAWPDLRGVSVETFMASKLAGEKGKGNE